MRNNSNAAKVGLVFLAGMAAGWVINMLTPPELRERGRRMIRRRAAKIRALMADPEERQRMKALFKQKADEMTASYYDARDSVIKTLSGLKESVSGFSREAYTTAVEEAINRIQEKGEIPHEQLDQLRQYLVDDYDRIKRRMRRNLDKT